MGCGPLGTKTSRSLRALWAERPKGSRALRADKTARSCGPLGRETQGLRALGAG